ncbi:hypothetical protein RQP46_000521 [Phenoliferia psychrophenolica]
MQATLDSVLLHAMSSGGNAPAVAPPPAVQLAADPLINYTPGLFFPPGGTLPELHPPAALQLPIHPPDHAEPLASTSEQALHSFDTPMLLPPAALPPSSAIQLDGRVAKRAKFRAESFAGGPVKFPMQMLDAEPKSAAPTLLAEKIITVADVEVLFNLHKLPFSIGRPGLYAQCREIAVRSAADNVFAGLSSVSIVQGCLILAHWNQPGYPTEGDRAYLFSGIAPWSLQPDAIKSDIAICCISELHSINSQAIDSFYSDGNSYTGANKWADHAAIIRTFLAQTDQWRSTTLSRVTGLHRTGMLDYGVTMADVYFNYYRTFFLSFGVHHALEKPELERDLTFYVVKGFESACAVIRTADKLGLRLRFGMDSTFVYITYAACFLLKLIHPMFTTLVDAADALRSASDAVALLERSAVDELHTPAIYAMFLKNLIDSKIHGSGERTNAPTRAPSGAATPIALDGTGETGAPLDLTASLHEIFGAKSADVSDDPVGNTHMSDTFWENMMMPGFGGRLGTLSGGGTAFDEQPQQTECWDEPSMWSRVGSPQPFSDFLFSSGV